jgi:hypothetical protein
MIGRNLHARTEEVNTVAMKSDFPCSTRIIESNNVLKPLLRASWKRFYS